ncbi:site-specific DNA-methyltransferase [Phascolarctobacterium faecium]|nr:site-specific DNA-methyltransferase [Phascolarctobacterium faecium]
MPKKKLTMTEMEKLRDIEAYTHDDKKRSNNPPVGMAKLDKNSDSVKTYSYDPHVDPSLQWAGKQEGMSFDVPTSSIHIHESIKPHRIIKIVRAISDKIDSSVKYMPSLFEEHLDPIEKMRKRQAAIEFYQHGVDWTNRMIAGDSLVIMNSLLEKENMAGQVQMVYFDPPYGIKYGSNFQPFVDKRDVKEKDEDLSQEPEMIKAFRDTWELGIHSYLSYLRDRLLLARKLLSDSGSVFIQISDENLHHIRELCDEIFGSENFISEIPFKTKIPLKTKFLANICDYIIVYSKNKNLFKYRQLFEKRNLYGNNEFTFLDDENNEFGFRRLNDEEKENINNLNKINPVFRRLDLSATGYGASTDFPIKFNGKIFYPTKGKSWKTTEDGIKRLIEKNRIFQLGERIYYKLYYNDFPLMQMSNLWNNTAGGFTEGKIYAVQTNPIVIQRCMLMVTDPGDLVLDITCGSGTTAYVAEQWGRRWITCDTSRVAIALAKKRLMTATFDYYKLAHPEQGVSSGFIYKTVPHITLGSIANNEAAIQEILYDQPEIDKKKVRVTGPFTVEALPAPVVRPIEGEDLLEENDITSKQDDWREQLRATGIRGRHGNKLMFSRVEPLSGTMYLQAEAETKEDVPRRAVICFGSETKPMDSRVVDMALDEAGNLRPTPQIIVFAAFQFDPEAAKMIAEINWPGVTLLTVQMNTDLMTADLKKKQSSDQSFWLVGQPDVELVKNGRSKDIYKVIVHGFDYYDVKKGTVESGSTSRIAMWMLDTNYDSMCINPQQVFFPIDGKSGGWNKLAKTLRAEIDQELIEKYAGTESLWFKALPNTRIAVKIIDDRGIESMKVIRIGDE